MVLGGHRYRSAEQIRPKGIDLEVQLSYFPWSHQLHQPAQERNAEIGTEALRSVEQERDARNKKTVAIPLLGQREELVAGHHNHRHSRTKFSHRIMNRLIWAANKLKICHLAVKCTIFCALLLMALQNVGFSQAGETAGMRERLLMDFGWRFAFGHTYDPSRDFRTGTSYFSYFAKAGYGDGAASRTFDDRSWRILDLPHDWAVELPFNPAASYSHGYKAIGREFPETSIGWYRKTFTLPASDLGRRISIEFDGIYRNSTVWVNGFYLGEEHSGYSGFRYDITDYLNYGGENVVAIRVDATMEEGWYYEGAGIYRHVWLTKTSPLHVAWNGTFVTAEVKEDAAVVTARTTIVNDRSSDAVFDIDQTIIDAHGKTVSESKEKQLRLKSGEQNEFFCSMKVTNPRLWSIEDPHQYRLITRISSDGSIADATETPFGIRTIRFDSNKGFFLNGEHVFLKGTNNHQDHAGVGTAIPDALQEFRIKKLKEMGANAYRCSHNPPTPELLDACDRLGMLVIDENRLVGTNEEHFSLLERMIYRDRNHPSVFIWSIGNEEWAIEGTATGARIASTMQAFVRRLDPTRRVVYPNSGWGHGISEIIDVMGSIIPSTETSTSSTLHFLISRASVLKRRHHGERAVCMKMTRQTHTWRQPIESPRVEASKRDSSSIQHAHFCLGYSSGPVLTIAVNRIPLGGRRYLPSREFSICVVSRRTCSSISNPGGRINRYSTFSRTGPGTKTRQSAPGPTATVMRLSSF
jgi:hypothetical protein